MSPDNRKKIRTSIDDAKPLDENDGAEAAYLARIPPQRTVFFIRQLDGLALHAWVAGEPQKSPEHAKVAADLRRAMRLTHKLVAIFEDQNNAAAVEPFWQESDSSMPADEMLRELLLCIEVALLRAPKHGGQSRAISVERPNAFAWELFVAKVCRLVQECGGDATTNRNTIDEGTIPRLLRLLLPYLPQGFLPEIMPAHRLDDINAQVRKGLQRAALQKGEVDNEG